MELLNDDTGQHASLYEICEWWLEKYPEDIFEKEPAEVVEIRRLMQRILLKRKSR
jgi:hypothetical protein